jgi:hypothetical protein
MCVEGRNMDEKDHRFTWVDIGFVFFVGVMIGDVVGFAMVGLTTISLVALGLFYFFCVRPVRGA